MTAKITYHAAQTAIIKNVTSFTAPKTDSFPYWTFWCSGEEGDLVDVYFFHVEGIKGVGVIGGERL